MCNLAPKTRLCDYQKSCNFMLQNDKGRIRMPWYIPLLSAILGASISFCSAFAITRYTFSRQIMQEKANRLNAFQIEISVLVQFLERAISEAAPDVIVMLPPKREFENLCVIYRGNCGKIGLLSTKVAKEIIAFYANAL